MYRRKFAILLMSGSALVGCQSLGITPTTWAQDATLLANGLAAIVPSIASIAGIPLPVAELVQNALRSAADYATQLAAIVSAGDATSLAQKVSQALNAAADGLKPYLANLPLLVSEGMSAAQVIVPVIIGLITGVAAAPGPGTMPVAQARMVLKSIAKK